MELNIEKNISLAEHTTLKVGGVADYFVVVETVKELQSVLQFAKQTAVPLLIIGEGSNILVSDKGYKGLVIKNAIKGFSYKIEEDSVYLSCGAGEILDELIFDSVQQGYWGLENLSAIPGTVGATPIQNVGAYGVEVSSLISEVKAVHVDTQEEKTFSGEECQFSYRDSFFKTKAGREWIVVSVTLRLSLESNPKLEYSSLKFLEEKSTLTPLDVRNSVIEIRANKFPDITKVGTAGSFFKNPVINNELYFKLQKQYPDLPGYDMGEGRIKVSLGYILDKICKLRGYCFEGVCLYENQALVLVNKDADNSLAIDKFADFIAEAVSQKTGITIEREVRKV